MILTVTLNPLLERRLIFNSVTLGNDYRCKKEFYSAGGKGINVSRQLNMLEMKNHSFTFLGGNAGKILRHCMTEDKIEFTVVSSKSETRCADLIIEEETNRITTFFGANSFITADESIDFKNKLEKMIQNCSVVVLSGSSPSPATDDIFPFAIKLAHEHDKTSVLDTYGLHLQDCLDAAPTIVHNNVEETEKSLGINLQSEESKTEYLHKLYNKGIKLSFLTDGANPAYAAKFDYIHKIESPAIDVIDATGSGDAFVAGIIHGIENSLVFEEMIKNASSLGVANAGMSKTCAVSFEDLNQYFHQVTVSTIGKKMKIIDDSPQY
jgi:tagatose 6-phosphate kinase